MEPSLLNSQTGNSVYGADTINNGSQILGYDYYLKKFNLNYKHEGTYLKVGDTPTGFGWVIYISVIRQQMPLFMEQSLEKLLLLNSSFTLPANSAMHTMILDGGFGYAEIGKVIAIYPANKDAAMILADQLIELTKSFAGPVIPTAIYLGGNVYTYFINELSPDHKVKWPFNNIKAKKITKTTRWIGKYLIISLLKGDAKGNVYKCLNLNNWRNIHWCVVKQGLTHQCTDDFGRSIKDRLEWQYELLKDLTGQVSMSKPIDYFQFKNDAYLVIEYIEGVHLYDKINQLHKGTMWTAIPVEAKGELLKILLDVVAIVDRFHEQGLVHRDISPGNFLAREDGSIVAIDIELTYDYCSNIPKPPYSLGTPGYISPQQIQFKAPDLEDDYYGLGGLMVKIFTGMSPSKFQGNDEEAIFKSMKFFTGNNAIASLISRCLAYDPALRPNIKSIRHTLSVYNALLLTNLNMQVREPQIKIHSDETNEIKEVIQKGINALAHTIMTDQFGHWIGKTAITNGVIANEFHRYGSNQSFANGNAGVLYMLANAEKLGFDLGSLNTTITRNLERLGLNSDRAEDDDTGLFYGSPGRSIAFCAMLNAGLLEKTIHFHNQIYKGLTKHGIGLNLATGIAGRGLAMLYCASLTNQQLYYKELHTIVASILREQRRDGSWLIKKDHSDHNGVKVLGFSDGIAGIVYFLMMHYSLYNDLKVEQAIQKALSWLLKQRVTTNAHMVWPLNSTNGIIDPWFENGFSGVAYTFIKAYKIFKEDIFKEAASDALKSHPKCISSNYININNGISGLGQVYIEAYKVFKDEDWKDRARYIVYYLIHCRKSNLDTINYWHDGNYTRPTSGYLSGNAGIINFLLHYLYPDKIEVIL